MIAKLITPQSNSLEDLQAYIAECSSVVRDKDPKSPAKLWQRLLTESYAKTASRVFEYVPCRIHVRQLPVVQQYFGFYLNIEVAPIPYEESYYHTTMRELLNWGWTVEDCLPYVDFTDYKTFKCEAPYFIYGQVSTHNQITSVSHSQRYGTCDRGYWMPPEFLTSQMNQAQIFETSKTGIPEILKSGANMLWNGLVECSSPTMLKIHMKAAGITRKEVWDRGADMLQNRVFTLGGYTSNPNAWPHFVDQRLDSHTQKETREFTQLIADQIK